MENMECDSDSDDNDFYEPIAREVEEFLNNIEDTTSIRSSAVSKTSIFPDKEDDKTVYINNALLLNKQSELKYKQLEESLYKTLLEIRQKIEENSQAIMAHSKTAINTEFNYLRCGKPYFKSKDNFPAPDNCDTITMRRAQMYDFYNVSCIQGWTVKDKTQLVSVLLTLSRNIRRKELISQINLLKNEDKQKNFLQIHKLEKHLHSLGDASLKDIALPLNEEYDWEFVANKLNRRHSAQEYRSLWKLFFHPSINKNNWTKSEHQTLQTLALQMNMQNWDLISTQLNTGRTGYQCFVYFRTNMINSLTNRKWTVEEVEYLQRVIEYFREGTYIPWGKVATAMDNRTKIQVYNKYIRLQQARKGRFLEEEDIVILNCYSKYGLNFKKMAQYLPGRSAVQIRTRFNILTRFRVSTTWTVADDRKLLQIMANQDTNSSFSTATQHFPGKDRMHIRSRYITLMKWMKIHPATDIALAPRRGARRLVHGYESMSLNDALANLNKRMESEVKKKKSGRLSRNSNVKDIESGIIAALVNEMKQEEMSKKVNVVEVPEVIDFTASKLELINVTNLEKMLLLLNASLSIDKFQMSKYRNIYKNLGNDKNPEVKVKSYSKSEKIKTLDLSNAPDIWGKITIGKTKYVLPPNFSTITGCRVLLNNTRSKNSVVPDDDINLGLMARKNVFFKEALTKLKNRFTTLFLWPLLLSNESPPVYDKDDIYILKPFQTKPKSLPHPTGVTIPIINNDKEEITEDIDLSVENSSKSQININYECSTFDVTVCIENIPNSPESVDDK